MALNIVLNYRSSKEIEWTLIHRAGNKPKALNQAEGIYVHGSHSLSLEGHRLHSLGNNPCQLPCKVPEASVPRGIIPLLSRLEVRATITAQ